MPLSVKRVVNVTVSLSPMAAQRRGFGTLLIIGDSDVLSDSESFRSYSTLEGVTEDFEVDAPEALAAQAYFSQTPQPDSLVISKWQAQPTSGFLTGANLSQVDFTTLQKDGAFKISVNGSEITVNVTASSAVDLDDIATRINTALGENASCALNGGALVITSKATGTGADVSYASAPDDGTDLSAIFGLTEGAGAKQTQGADHAQSAVEAVSQALEDFGRDFYGVIFAAQTALTDNDYLEIAQLIEASGDSHIFGITLTDPKFIATPSNDAANVDSAVTGQARVGEDGQDLPTKLKNGQFTRTITFYSPYVEGDSAYQLNPYFAASALGRMFTVDFDGSRTTLTLKFKQAPSLQPGDYSETQANRLEDKNVNIYAMYDNDTYIIEQGEMASGMHADERHGLDWLQDAIQTAIFNVLYQSKTKIPQTDDGMAMIVSAIEKVLNQAVDNGLVASGVWNSDGFGTLENGDTLANGYYVYAASVNDQDQSQREAREAPAIQCAVKLAGAIESVDVTVNVNR